MSTRVLVAIAATITFVGCGRANNQPAVQPHASANWIEPKSAASPTVASQPGFENELANPDQKTSAYESDVGEPRWRNNPGSYDDGVRPKRTEAPSNQNAIQNNRSVPPTTFSAEQ